MTSLDLNEWNQDFNDTANNHLENAYTFIETSDFWLNFHIICPVDFINFSSQNV